MMKKRVFICASDPFPFGTANSNYIRNYVKCLIAASYDVFVIGIGKNRDCDKVGENYQYAGAAYTNIDIPLRGAKNLLKAELTAGNKMYAVMKRFEIGSDDYVCIYSGLFSVIHNALRVVPGSHLISIEVEWLQPFQYQHGKRDLMYLIWNTSFNYRLRKIEKFFPISRTLAKHIGEKGKNACVIPVMTDSTDIPCRDIKVRKDGVTHFIYSGAATNKDSFPCMIEALYSLSEEELDKICLHFTSLKEETLIACLGENQNWLDKIRKTLIFHGWLEYEDLMQVYDSMDFILLAREENLATLSNFPSKIPELMTHAVVPICSDVGDYTELYMQDGKDSLIFKGAEASSCCEAIKRAVNLSDKQLLEMKKNARQTVEKRFDYCNWTDIVDSFISGRG